MGNLGFSSGSSTEFRVPSIPTEVLEHVFSFVPAKDLLHNCARVCKDWNTVINGNSLWKIKIDRELGPDTIPQLPGYQFDLKRIYVFRPFNRNLIKNGNAAGVIMQLKVAKC